MSTRASLPELLTQARHQRRLSQLELSHRVGVSARHLGFVEVGRSRPGRALLLRWLEELDVPLGVRNEALLLAGHAPAYDDSPLAGASLAEARRALEHLLDAHDPLPALVLDRDWNLVAGNGGLQWLADVCGARLDLSSAALTVGDRPGPNLLDLVLDPNGLGRALVNLEEVAPAVLQHLRQDALSNPGLDPLVGRLAALVPSAEPPAVLPPTLVTRYATSCGELAFLSMFTTFGTPQSITLASLRVELLFAADEATRRAVAGR